MKTTRNTMKHDETRDIRSNKLVQVQVHRNEHEEIVSFCVTLEADHAAPAAGHDLYHALVQ